MSAPDPNSEPPTSPTVQVQRTPLPLDIRDRILSHLIPPTPPLPPELLSRDFLERLAFLPPAPDDIDGQLSPFTSPSPNALAEALAACELSPPSATQYTYDGTMMARTLVQPADYLSAADDRKTVEIGFEQDEDRGWVYRGSKFSIGGDDDGWYSDVEEVPVQPAEAKEERDEVKDYWAGWSSPESDSTGIQEQDDEDAYWAQYGAGPPQPEYPAPSPRAHSPAPYTAPAPVASPPKAASSGSPDIDSITSQTAALSTSQPSLLEEKLVAKLKCQLLKAWAQFRGSSPADDECAVLAWLRVCRNVNSRPAWGFVSTEVENDEADEVHPGMHQDAEVKEMILRTRVENIRDIFEVLGKDKSEFWRWCEEAIRVRQTNEQEKEDYQGV